MKLTSIDPMKSRVAVLHRDCVISGLDFKLRVLRYRSRMLFTSEEQLLDRILVELSTIIKQLSALTHREDGVVPEHISSHVDRYLARMDPGCRAEGTR